MSDDTPKKKKKTDPNTMEFTLVHSADDADNDGFTNGKARYQAKRDLHDVRRAIDLFNLELQGYRQEQNVGLTISFDNWKLGRKRGAATIALASASAATGIPSVLTHNRTLGLASIGLGVAAFVPTGLAMLLDNNCRKVKKDYQGDKDSERDVRFEYSGNEILVPVTPANMNVIARSYEAGSEYLQSVRAAFFTGKKSREEVAENVRKTITDYILDHGEKVKTKPIVATRITVSDVASDEIPNSGLPLIKKQTAQVLTQ